MKRLFMSYDNSGFENALALGNDEHFDSTHSYTQILESLIADGNHDLFNGHCLSYQIYNQDGLIVFESGKSLKSGEVA